MYDDSGKIPIGSSKLLVILIIAIIVVFAGTIVLNGGFSSPAPEESDNSSDVGADSSSLQYKMVGHNSYGTVTKISGLGNPSSDIKVALIVGVGAKQKSSNSIIPTLQNDNMLNYCYDIYIVNATSSSNNQNNTNNDKDMSVNEKSISLASEFAVPDIINNNYNFTVDVHSTNDSNSYVFVPSENTYTSKIVVDYISNNTNVGKYTPDSHSYTESISEKIISYEIPSIVYVTKEYYADGISSEIDSVIMAIDDFDFVGLFSSDNDVSTDDSSSDDNYENTVTVSSSSKGNQEIN